MIANEVIETSNHVVTCIEKNEMGKIKAELSDQSAEELIVGLTYVASNLSTAAFETISKIYTNAILAQERLEIKDMQDEATILKRFNDQVDNVILQLDLKDIKTVENFERVIESLRRNLREQLSGKKKRSLLGMLFKRNL